MIIQKTYKDENGVEHFNLMETYSDNPDKTLLQVQTGAIYDRAIDVVPVRYTYEEVDREPDNVVEFDVTRVTEDVSQET